MVLSTDSLVHTISKDIPPAHAAFAEPLSCALHAVERAQITFADVVVIAGCGPIGLGMIAGARGQVPGRDRGPRHGPPQAGAGPPDRRDSDPRHRRGGRRRTGQGDDRRLRRGRLHGGHRAPLGRPPGPQRAAQARPVRRVLRLQGGRGGRLEHHQRRQGARRPRRAPRPQLLARRHPAHRGRPASAGRHLHPPAAAVGVPEGPGPRRLAARSRSRSASFPASRRGAGHDPGSGAGLVASRPAQGGGPRRPRRDGVPLAGGVRCGRRRAARERRGGGVRLLRLEGGQGADGPDPADAAPLPAELPAAAEGVHRQDRDPGRRRPRAGRSPTSPSSTPSWPAAPVRTTCS